MSKSGHSRRQYSNQRKEQQRLLCDLSIRLFQEALAQVPATVRMTHRASIFPFAAHIVLKLSDKRDLVLRLGLRMAGEPGRPFVPSFVREAGIQMLLMSRSVCFSRLIPLHADSSRANNTALRQETVDVGSGVSQESLGRSDQRIESVDGMRIQDLVPRSDMISEPNHEHDMVPDQAMAEFPFIPDHGPTIFDPHSSAENLFTFDISDLPYVPNPIQPPFNNILYTQYPSDELDALMWSASPQSFGNADDQRQDAPVNGVSGAQAVPTPFGMPMDATAMETQCNVQTCQEASTWRPTLPSPSSTAFGSNTNAPSAQNRNPQQEILMATVGWLNQIANLMQ